MLTAQHKAVGFGTCRDQPVHPAVQPGAHHRGGAPCAWCLGTGQGEAQLAATGCGGEGPVLQMFCNVHLVILYRKKIVPIVGTVDIDSVQLLAWHQLACLYTGLCWWFTHFRGVQNGRKS